MLRFMFLMACTGYLFTGFSQTQQAPFPFYNDSIRPDAYMRWVDQKTDSIRDILNTKKDLTQRYTLSLEFSRTIRTGSGDYILQNPYSMNQPGSDTCSLIIPASVYVFQQEILAIHLGGDIVIENTSSLDESTSFMGYPGIFYFDHNALIFAAHACGTPSAFIGSCGGTSSSYTNYFKDGIYYSSIIGGKTYYCGCGFNYIIPEELIQQWMDLVKTMN